MKAKLEDTDDHPLIDSEAFGSATASFLISINTLILLRNKGILSEAEMMEAIIRARKSFELSSTNLGINAADAARNLFDLAEALFLTSTSQESVYGKN